MIFRACITEIIRRSDSVKSFRFKRPEDFEYKAGQYIVVTLDINGKSVSKPFSLSSSPTEEHLEFTKKLTGHDFSNALNSLETDQEISISGPLGKMTYEGEHEKIALLSGGIGITPMRSICKYCTDKNLDTAIMLICSDRSEEDMVFRNELIEMIFHNQYLAMYQTLTRASEKWTGPRERISADTLIEILPDLLSRVFYVCGPPAMVDSMLEVLKGLDVPDANIKKESLVGY